MLFWLIGCFFTAFFLGDRAAREKSKKIIRNDIEVGPLFFNANFTNKTNYTNKD